MLQKGTRLKMQIRSISEDMSKKPGNIGRYISTSHKSMSSYGFTIGIEQRAREYQTEMFSGEELECSILKNKMRNKRTSRRKIQKSVRLPSWTVSQMEELKTQNFEHINHRKAWDGHGRMWKGENARFWDSFWGDSMSVTDPKEDWSY